MKLLLLLLALTKPIPTHKVLEATALMIYNDYNADEQKADAKYKDKRVLLHGIVQRQSANMWSVYLVVPDPKGMPVVIGDDQITKVPIYNPGMNFDLNCMGVGKIMGMPLFLDCRLP